MSARITAPLLLSVVALAATARAQGVWTGLLDTVTRPSSRTGAAGAGERDTFYVFAGRERTASGDVLLGDLWSRGSFAWTSLATGPSPREHAAVCLDTSRRVLVVFGGFGGTSDPTTATRLADTWEYDIATGVWQNRTPTPPAQSPSARRGAAMAFDASTGRCLLFGGEITPGLNSNETWGWNGTQWTLLAPATIPEPRALHGMAYDPVTRSVWMIGGTTPVSYTTPRGTQKTLSWDGGNWNLVTPTVDVPDRIDFGLAFDEYRDRLVLLGGDDGSLRGDTWEFDRTTWLQRMPVSSPSARRGVAMAYVPDQQETLLRSGDDGSTSLPNDTFFWATSAPAGFFPAGAQLPGCPDGSGRVVFFEALRLPWIGDTFEVVARNVNPGLPVVALFGGPPPMPVDLTPIGAPGCTGWFPNHVVAPMGIGPDPSLAVPLPADPLLIGVRFAIQAAIFDPTANALGIAFSDVGGGEIGAR